MTGPETSKGLQNNVFHPSLGVVMSRSRWFVVVVRPLLFAMAGALLLSGAGNGLAARAGVDPKGPGHAAKDPGVRPTQRQSAPTGPAEVGKNLNNVIPPSLRSQYPLTPVTSQSRGGVQPVAAADPPARGFDAKTSKELPARRNKFEQVYANPDGTETTAFSQVPVNYQRPDGSWAPIDSTLTRDPIRGDWSAPKNDLVTRIADRVTATPDTASVAFDRDHEISWGVQSATPAAAKVSGPEATFSGIGRDADLKLAATTDGVKESVILHSTAAALSYTFPLRLKGLTAKLTGNEVKLIDEHGVTRGLIPAGSMVDAAQATSSGVRYTLIRTPGGGQALRLDADAAWVRDPARVFPITVDPTVTGVSSLAAITVRQNDVLSGNDTLQIGCRPPQPDRQDCTAAGTQRGNVYLSFNRVVDVLAHEKILGAQLSLLNFDSGSCSPRWVDVYPVRETWSLDNASWPGPAIGPAITKRSFNHGFMPIGQTHSACPFKQEVFDLYDAGRKLIQSWVDGTSPNYGLAVRATNPNDRAAWKMFTGTKGQKNPPRLYITHTPYNATYKLLANPAPVMVTPTTAGRYPIRVTNKSAFPLTTGDFYLGYRLFDGRTRKVITPIAVASTLPQTLQRNASVTLTGVVPPLAGEVNGKPYIVEFTLVHKTKGKIFTDEGTPPARANITVYNTPPTSKRWWPVNGYQAPTLRPTLAVTASDLESPPSALTYRFEVCESVPGNDRLNCFYSGTGTTGSYGAAASWTIPAGKLSWNKKYKWRVYVKDGGGVVEPTLPALTLLTEVPQPVLTSKIANSPNGTGDHDFDPQVGNYTTAITDATVAVSGPSLDVIRTYNSLDPRRTGAFGAGWTSRYDMVLRQEGAPGNILLTYPDGQQVRFGLNPDGKWVAPSDRKATLVKDATGWTLRGTGATSYRFDLTGRLAQVTEGTGKPLVLAYGTDGKLATVTSQSGANRKLTFTWSGAHVASVSTDPVNGAALTWSYTYTGDVLTKVCDPRGSCTSYESSPGSHYRSAVLDSRPESYWRFDDEQDDPATSDVDINLGDDNGSYQGSVSYGTPGAIAGSTDTGVSLGASGTASVDVKKSLFRRMSDAAIEVWFKTSSTTAGPLIGYQTKAIGTTSTGGMPILYVGSDGKLRGQFWNGAASPITAPAIVNNDQWHHAVLSAEGTKQTLYLDGAAVGSLDGGRVIQNDGFTVNQWGAAYAVTVSAWPGYGTAARTTYRGALDEGAIYSHPLSAKDVADHYQLGRNPADQLTKITEPSGKVLTQVEYDSSQDRVTQLTDDDGGSWKLAAPVTDGGADDLRRTVTVTDPADRTWFYEYDALGGWLLRSGRPNGLGVRPEDMPLPDDDGDYDWNSLEGIVIRSYTHDADGRMTKVTDERGAEQRFTYDDRGNLNSQTSCRVGNATDCHTSYTSYQAGLTDPLDPRWDLPLVTRDGRSASATDNTYATTRTYTATGALASVNAPKGQKSSDTYTDGTEAAAGGGTMPIGLLRTETDGRGAVTTYSYDSGGLLLDVLEATGLRTAYTYDAIGRRLTETTKVAGRPNATTTYEYDKSSRVSAAIGPATTDAVSGQQHQLRTELSYDIDGNVETVTAKDVLDPSAEPRVTRQDYDDHNRLAQVVDPDGGETAYEYDRFGNKTSETDAKGNHVEYAYTARNMVAEVRLYDADDTGAEGYTVVDSRGYDQAGRQVRQGDALGRNIRYDYNDDNTVKRAYLQGFHDPDGTTRDYTLSQKTYDGAGNLLTEVSDNGKTTVANTLDEAGRTIQSVVNPGSGPGIVSRTTNYTYDPVRGDLTRTTTTGTPSGVSVPAQTAVTDNVYDQASGQLIEQRAQTSAAPDPVITQVTRWTYDQSGQPLTMTQPRGNTTATADDAFTTKYTYDSLGRQVKEEAPPVATEINGGSPVTARPTTLTGYDGFGAVASTKDPLGNVVKSTYNKRGLPVEVTAPSYTPPSGGAAVVPKVSTSYDELGRAVSVTDERGNVTRYSYDRAGRRTSVDAPTSSNDDRAVWNYSYLRNGLVSSVTDPNGARQEWTYDDLDRQVTSTQVERRPALVNLTAKTTWDDAGNPTTITSPSGATTVSSYDPIGQLLKQTDPNGVETSFGYDSAGNQTLMKDGLGRTVRTGYDLVGQPISATTLDKDGVALGTTKSGYDLDGNVVTSSTASQHVTTSTYDALGQLVRQIEPVAANSSVTTTYGYDANGNITRVTDGRGNATLYTTNSLGLPEKVIEPSTTAHPGLPDRTWTASYDAAGNPVVLDAPGGIRQTRTFDAAGRMTREDGAGAATTSNVLGYDHVGQLTSAGSNAYTYNDRGQLLTANGPSGDASYGYDDDGNLTRRTDAAGTADFGYTKDRLTTMTDPVTRTPQTIGYNGAGQVASIDYGSGRVRGIGYDAFGRMSSDVLKNSAGTTVASTSYGYNVDDQVNHKVTTGVDGAGDNSYTYDDLGRLATWTVGGQTTSYSWDAASNRTKVAGPSGTKTATYDERNRLLSDGTSTYSYTARGTLASKTTAGSTLAFSFDAFDRLIAQGTKTLSYDSLDRETTNGPAAFKYAGFEDDPVADGTQTFGHGLADDVLAVGQGASKRLTLADRHGDIVGGFDPADTALTGLVDSRTFDPFGQLTATDGSAYGVGFQSDWTDPATGQVDMGARWYDTGTGTFDSRDTVQWPAGTSSSESNLFAYGAGDPVTNVDTDGHSPYDPEKNLGQCYYKWIPPDLANEKFGYFKLICPPKPPKTGDKGGKKPGDGKKPGSGKTGGGKTGGGKTGGGHTGGGHSGGGKPTKPACDSYCQAEKQRQKDIAKTERTKQAVKTQVQTTTVATPGVQSPHCSGGNATCPTYTGRPSATTGDTKGFDDKKGSDKARQELLKIIGSVSTEATEASKPSFWEQLGEYGLPGSRVENDPLVQLYLHDPAALHSLYDVIGFLPGVGEFADVQNAMLYAYEGDYWNSGLSVVGAIPFGDLAKFGLKGAKASGLAGKIGGKVLKALGKCSFAGDTPVVMADGSTRPISQIKVGDQVQAADPETGERRAAKVTKLWSHEDTVVRLEVEGGTLTTTANHPFWNATDQRFERADQLDPGDQLKTADGGLAKVISLDRGPATPITAYNLTIDGIHTYYVEAGSTSVLVHNTCGPKLGVDAPHAGNVAVIGRQEDTAVALGWPGHDVLNSKKWSPELNDAWVNAVIKNKQDVYVASPLTYENLWDPVAGRQRVLKRELDMLLNSGYKWDGYYLRPPR